LTSKATFSAQHVYKSVSSGHDVDKSANEIEETAMIRLKTTAVSALAITTILAGIAIAQVGGGVGVGVSGEAGVGAAGGGIGAGASGGAAASGSDNAGGMGASGAAGAEARGNADVSTGTNFGRAISAIRTANNDIDALASASSISVVDIEAEVQGENAVALDNAVADN
jgi:hypothetical protein